MTVDLWLLVAAVVLTLAQAVISVQGALSQVSLPILADNREDMPALTGWAGRAQRAHRNMLENLVLFAALVLVAHVSGKASEMTALGAHIFFWARLVYTGVYIAGIAWLRTGVWLVSVIGLALIFFALF